MPELPEVETVRRGLVPAVTARTIQHVEVLHERPVRRHLTGSSDFADRLVGQTFNEPRRRGKFLWFPLASGEVLLAHLGMSGQFRVDDAAQALPRNTRIVFAFADGDPQLRFVDQRMFGGMWMSAGAQVDGTPIELAHIARDPLDEAFDAEAALRRLLLRKAGVKHVLLDQSWVSGIGNIYADEALWRARLHWAQPGETISVRKGRELLGHVRQVLEESIAQGGTAFDELYVNVNGESGYFDRLLRSYGRTGEPCNRCGTPIVREKFMNRSSFRCPRCQRLR